jgi:hypothetical protein
MTTDTIELQSSLAQFIGTEQYYVNPLYRWLKYTDGVKYFAENAGGGAYWFLDIIGTELLDLARREGFLTIELLVREDSSACIVVTDGNGHTLKSRPIDATDCPTGNWRFFIQSDVLMLTSEY